MVASTDTRGGEQAKDRGQLVLIGAVAIAFVLIGLVVLFNGVVFTENVGSEGAIVDAKSSGTTTFAIEQNLGEAAHTVHTNNKYDQSEDDLLKDHLNETIKELDDWQRLQTGETRGVVTQVEFQDSITEEGTLVLQDDTSDFSDAGGDPDWNPVPSGTEETRVDEFVMRIEEPTSSGTMTIDIDDGSDEAIDIVADGSSSTIELNNAEGSPIQNPGNCENLDSGADDQIILRITDGFVAQRPECRFSLSDPTEDQSIEFDNGDQLQGTFEFVAEDDPDDGQLAGYQSAETPTSNPHRSLIAWEAEYDIVVAGPTVDQRLEDRKVEHYG
jgi:hypothetical protein